QFGELAVGRRFESDQHQVANTDFLRRAGAPGVDMKIPDDTADAQAFGAHPGVVGTEQKMSFLSVAAELGAVVTAERAATDHADLHRGIGTAAGWSCGGCRPRPVTPTHHPRRSKKGTLNSQSALGKVQIA